MTDINLVLGVSTIFHQLPSTFINRFSTFEQKSFNDSFFFGEDNIFHSSLSLVDNDFISTLENFSAFDIINQNKIRRFSFDIGPWYKKVKLIDNKYVGVGGRLNTKDIFEICEKKIEYLMKKLNAHCKLAVENLNYYDTGAYEDVCEPQFYNEFCEKFNVALVFDIPHAQVTAHNKNIDYNKYVSSFDQDLIQEIHLSKMKVLDQSTAIDYHGIPDQEEFNLLYELIKNKDKQYDVVVEYWKDPIRLVESYQKLEAFVNNSTLIIPNLDKPEPNKKKA